MSLVSVREFDPTGLRGSNKITNEPIVINPLNRINDISYALPRAAPFFAKSLIVKDGTGAGAKTLLENVDYWIVFDFISPTIALTNRIACGIALIDSNYSGTLYVTYQALGGNYTFDDKSAFEEIIRKRYVSAHVAYDEIIGLPAGFAPDWHTHEVADLVGMSSVVTGLEQIATEIAKKPSAGNQASAALNSHLSNNNAHTPTQVGLGNVYNYGIATQAEIAAGASNKYVSALGLKQYVATVGAGGGLTKDTADKLYAPYSLTNSAVTQSQADGRYAAKNDSYTRTEIDNMLGQTGGSTDGYTKAQADGRFASKTSLQDYLTSDQISTTYVKSLDLTKNYLTKGNIEQTYARIDQTYTKSDVDSTFMKVVNTYTKTDANKQFYSAVSGSALNNKVNDFINFVANGRTIGKVESIGITRGGDGKYSLLLNQTMVDVGGLNVKRLDSTYPLPILDSFAKTTDLSQYAKKDTGLKAALPVIYKKTQEQTYRSQKYMLEWTFIRQGDIVDIYWGTDDRVVASDRVTFMFETGALPNVTSNLAASFLNDPYNPRQSPFYLSSTPNTDFYRFGKLLIIENHNVMQHYDNDTHWRPTYSRDVYFNQYTRGLYFQMDLNYNANGDYNSQLSWGFLGSARLLLTTKAQRDYFDAFMPIPDLT